MKSRLVWGWLLFCVMPIDATEFLYPVAVREDGIFYLIYQKTPHHIELWEWHRNTKQAEQLLFSRFTPAGFQLLPTHDGFSFIDNGTVKIKKFIKRSPRIIEFDAPIYQVELVHWIDDCTYYASGKYQNNFGIFHFDYEGDVMPLCLKDALDCMYPQKIDNFLFYIERDERMACKIMQMHYQPAHGDTFAKRLAWYYKHQPPSSEIAAFERPVIFLSMISTTEGFAIGHQPFINRSDETIMFDYYHLIKKEGGWQVDTLFSFAIPSDLLYVGSTMRLYESLLPLLPRHYGNKIIFTHTAHAPRYCLFVYDLGTGSINEIAQSHQLFPPLAGISGGELTGPIMMGMEENREIKIELVKIGIG